MTRSDHVVGNGNEPALRIVDLFDTWSTQNNSFFIQLSYHIANPTIFHLSIKPIPSPSVSWCFFQPFSRPIPFSQPIQHTRRHFEGSASGHSHCAGASSQSTTLRRRFLCLERNKPPPPNLFSTEVIKKRRKKSEKSETADIFHPCNVNKCPHISTLNKDALSGKLGYKYKSWNGEDLLWTAGFAATLGLRIGWHGRQTQK